MIITVYDFENDKREISLPDKEIIEINVTVLSGDETGYVRFDDGERVYFDASDCREHSYYDGQYVVEGEGVKEWINYPHSRIERRWRTFSYDRQSIFGMEE